MLVTTQTRGAPVSVTSIRTHATWAAARDDAGLGGTGAPVELSPAEAGGRPAASASAVVVLVAAGGAAVLAALAAYWKCRHHCNGRITTLQSPKAADGDSNGPAREHHDPEGGVSPAAHLRSGSVSPRRLPPIESASIDSRPGVDWTVASRPAHGAPTPRRSREPLPLPLAQMGPLLRRNSGI